MKKYVTKGGKNIEIYTDSNSSLYRIKFTSGGELPWELGGLFTSTVFADIAIKGYLQKEEDKESRKAKKVENATDKVRETV